MLGISYHECKTAKHIIACNKWISLPENRTWCQCSCRFQVVQAIVVWSCLSSRHTPGKHTTRNNERKSLPRKTASREDEVQSRRPCCALCGWQRLMGSHDYDGMENLHDLRALRVTDWFIGTPLISWAGLKFTLTSNEVQVVAYLSLENRKTLLKAVKRGTRSRFEQQQLLQITKKQYWLNGPVTS